MKVENKHRSKIIRFLNGKTFYVVLCVCFLAIGIAAWSGVEGLKNIERSENPSSEPKVSVPSVPSQPLDTGLVDDDGDEQAKLPDDGSFETQSESEIESESDSEQSEQAAAPVAGFFINPVLGEVLKDYSATELQYSMTMRDMRLHKAVDIAADQGTPVIAAGEGVVTQVYSDPMYGTTVVIDHGNGIEAKYCGLNTSPAVKVGDTVDTSTQLGTVDIIPCESVEQRHLHLEFYNDGEAVSPMDYIAQ